MTGWTNAGRRGIWQSEMLPQIFIFFHRVAKPKVVFLNDFLVVRKCKSLSVLEVKTSTVLLGSTPVDLTASGREPLDKFVPRLCWDLSPVAFPERQDVRATHVLTVIVCVWQRMEETCLVCNTKSILQTILGHPWVLRGGGTETQGCRQ